MKNKFPDNMKLLVVDDNKSIHALFTCIFKEFNFKITCAKNGEEALELLRLEDFDMLFIDLVMPKVYGLDIIKRLKDSKRSKIPKIVLMTGAEADELIAEAIELGALGCLRKPFEAEEVMAIVNKTTF